MLKNIILITFSLASIFGMNLIFIDNDLKVNSIKENISHNREENKREGESEYNLYIEDNIDTQMVSNGEKNSSNIEGYIRQLSREAEDFTDKAKYSQAISKYNEIIQITKKSKDIKFLKIFAGVSFLKAYLYYYYKNDTDSAIEVYNSVIQKFRNSSNSELLKLYFKAQKSKVLLLTDDVQKLEVYRDIVDRFSSSTEDEFIKMYIYAQQNIAQILEDEDTKNSLDIYNDIIEKTKYSNNLELKRAMIEAENSRIKYLIVSDKLEEAIDAYNEIIENSKNDNRFYNEVSKAMLEKSFFLSTKDKIKALDVLDELITRELTNGDTKSQNFEFAVINAIELSIILDIDDSKYKNLLETYIKPENREETIAEYEMLQILQKAQYSNQDETIRKWDKRYKSVKFDNWDFGNLEDWITLIEGDEAKNRIIDYLNYFEQKINGGIER